MLTKPTHICGNDSSDQFGWLILYIINSKNYFTFYHGKGNITPTIKDIKDEYARLPGHPLHTITQHVRYVLNHREEDNDPCDVSNIITE